MEDIRRSFAEIVAPGGGRIAGELDQGALLIAKSVDTNVDVGRELGRLDELAAAVAPGIAEPSVGDLAIELFGGSAPASDHHFTGAAADYYNPENSLLNRVLDRRVGIPITLAVVLIEVGRRRGLHLHGVGMPAHFLVGSAEGFVDPFHGGRLLSAAGCEQLFQRFAGRDAVLPPGALDRTPPALILKRMLMNLAGIAVHQQHRRMLRAVRALLATYPDADHRDHVQHAYAAAEVGQFDEAAQAAERALVTVPAAVVDKLQAQIDGWRARLN